MLRLEYYDPNNAAVWGSTQYRDETLLGRVWRSVDERWWFKGSAWTYIRGRHFGPFKTAEDAAFACQLRNGLITDLHYARDHGPVRGTGRYAKTLQEIDEWWDSLGPDVQKRLRADLATKSYAGGLKSRDRPAPSSPPRRS